MTRAMRENRGVISLKSLQAIGFSADEVAGFVSHGDLQRLHRAVYADGRNRLTDDAHLRAALLTIAGDVWLSGRTAAYWYTDTGRYRPVDLTTALIAVFRRLWALQPEDAAAETWHLLNLGLDRLEASPTHTNSAR